MEVHAHTHTPRKKWTHYFWEFLMLFLAVFCGFLAEYQLEHKIEKDRAKEYARMMKEDLVKDTLQLNSFMANKDRLRKIEERLARIFMKDKDSVNFGDFYFVWGWGANLDVYIPNDVTYSQMKNSGSLRYFKNTALLGKLAMYDWEIKRFTESNHKMMGLFGGMESRHYAEFIIDINLFGRKHGYDVDTSKSVKSAGFDFRMWDLGGIVLSNIRNILNSYNDYQYPRLKQIVSEAILLLNKAYHLE